MNKLTMVMCSLHLRWITLVTHSLWDCRIKIIFKT